VLLAIRDRAGHTRGTSRTRAPRSGIAESVLRAIARVIEQRGEVVTHNAVEHRGLWFAAGITTRGRRRGIGGEHVRRCGEAGTMPLGRAHNLGGLERDLRRGCPPVGRSRTRCPDPGQAIAASRWSCASTRRERSTVTSGLPRGSSPRASVSARGEAPTFDIVAVPERHPVQGSRSISGDTVLAPKFEDQA
jgi:hypothetical protein